MLRLHPTDKMTRMDSLCVNYNTVFLSVLEQFYFCGFIDLCSLSHNDLRTCGKNEGRKIERNREEAKTE